MPADTGLHVCCLNRLWTPCRSYSVPLQGISGAEADCFIQLGNNGCDTDDDPIVPESFRVYKGAWYLAAVEVFHARPDGPVIDAGVKQGGSSIISWGFGSTFAGTETFEHHGEFQVSDDGLMPRYLDDVVGWIDSVPFAFHGAEGYQVRVRIAYTGYLHETGEVDPRFADGPLPCADGTSDDLVATAGAGAAVIESFTADGSSDTFPTTWTYRRNTIGAIVDNTAVTIAPYSGGGASPGGQGSVTEVMLPFTPDAGAEVILGYAAPSGPAVNSVGQPPDTSSDRTLEGYGTLAGGAADTPEYYAQLSALWYLTRP